MLKKHLTHLSRATRIGIEIAGVLALCLFVAWGALLWRLSQGPLRVDFIAQALQKELNAADNGFQVGMGTAELSWNGSFTPISLDIRDIDIHRDDGTPVMRIGQAGVGLSQKKLLIGQVSLRSISVVRPALRLIRWEDGQVTLNTQEAPTEEVVAPQTSEKDQSEIFSAILAQLQGEDTPLTAGMSAIKDLRKVSMTGATILYDDRILKTYFMSHNADVSILKKKKGIGARVSVILDAPEGKPQGFVRGELYFDRAKKKGDANLSFSDINPSQLGLSGDKADKLSGVALSFSGVADMAFDDKMQVRQLRFAVGSTEGELRIPGLYEQPLPIKSIFLRGIANPAAKIGRTDKFEIAFADGPRAEASISVMPAGEEVGVRDINVDAALHAMPMDSLKSYWPESLTPDPRAWVLQHLTKGIADKATLKAVLRYNPTAEHKVTPIDVGGDIDFHGIKVDYYPPLLPATDAKGRAFYDIKSFNLDINGGTLKDMKVTGSKIRITGLDEQDHDTDSNIDIDVSLSGPLKTALEVLDSKPLNYPSALGIKTDGVDGKTDVAVNFKFPLNKNLKIEQVDVRANAKLADIRLPGIVAGMDITGGPMTLDLGDSTLHVAGKAFVSDMAADFDWKKFFSDKSKEDSKLTAQISLTPDGLKKFGLPDAVIIKGNMPADATYTLSKNGEAVLGLSANIINSEIGIPAVNATKPSGMAGSLGVTLNLKNDRLTSVRDLNMTSNAVTLRGGIDLDTSTAQTSIRKADLPTVKLAGTDIMLRAEPQKDGYLLLDINGRQLDASSFFPDETPPNSDEEAAKMVQPVRVRMKLAKLITGKDRGFDNVTLAAERNKWGRMDSVDFYALAGGKGVTVKYLPDGFGKRLNVDAQNAGMALYGLGLTKSLREGQLVISAKTPPGGGSRDLRGSVLLANFGLKDAPLIAKLLNAMSLSGIQSLLNGDGVQFKKAKVDFDWIDIGQPQQKQNVRMLKLKDGQTSGSSLGLTFEGNIDNWKNIYDLTGTIIPVSDLNKMLNVVPVIGSVLTAGGEGIIAATYKIKGPQSDPSISVNPLAVLAPGILRKIFFE